jgi:membrane protein
MIPRLSSRYYHLVWASELSALPWWRAVPVYLLRMLQVLIRDLSLGDLNLRAMSLVYTTLLSMVPLLALSFSVLKAFGVHEQIRPMLLSALEPLGEKGIEITDRVIEFVNNMNVGVLGALGLVLLFYTVISLMQKIEQNLNHIWRVVKLRSLARRFSDYLSVIMTGPVLIFFAMGLSTSAGRSETIQYLISIEPLGTLAALMAKVVPILLIAVAFTFVYLFMPNTRVQFRAALIGGLLASLMWQTVGWVFAAFIAGSTKYAAIYSAFATIILFMIWLYLSWLILLLGSSIAFYVQNPRYITPAAHRILVLSNRMREYLALSIMGEIARLFYTRKPPCNTECLAEKIGVSGEMLEPVLQMLEAGGYVEQLEDAGGAFLPAVPLDVTQVAELLEDVRGAGGTFPVNEDELFHNGMALGILKQVSQAGRQSLNGQTIKDLIEVEEVVSGS